MVPYMWDRVKGHLQRGVERSHNLTLDDLFVGCCDQTKQLWIAEKGSELVAAMVTAIETVNDVKQCSLQVAGGSEVDGWLDYLPPLADWAKSNGCEKFKIYGRIGWARKLGFDVVYTEMEKKL